MTLNQEYDKWIKQVYFDQVNDVQRLEMKKAWFSGMYALMSQFDEATRSDNEDICVTKMKALYDEIRSTIKPWTK